MTYDDLPIVKRFFTGEIDFSVFSRFVHLQYFGQFVFAFRLTVVSAIHLEPGAPVMAGGITLGDRVKRLTAFANKLRLNNSAPENDFVTGYENPVAWHRKFDVPRDQLTKDVLFDNVDMKYTTLAQYQSDKPEYIKWKL